MNAYQLFLADGRPTSVWACGACHRLTSGAYANQDGEADAEGCCAPKQCEECGYPLADRDRNTHCEPCRDRRQRERDAATMAAAEKLETWDGWVYWDGHGSNDGYFESLGDLLDWHADETADSEEADPLPEFVHVCREEPFPLPDAERLYEEVTDDSFEGAYDSLEGKVELEAALRVFQAANAGLVSYTPDFKRAVRVTAGVG